MTIEELQKKVEAAELKVEKCQKTIERHKSQLEKKEKQLRDMGIDPENADKYDFAQQNTPESYEIYGLLCDYGYKKEDIKGAERKLLDAQHTCDNWKKKLDLQINREKVIQDQVPQVIKDFLQDWKEKSFQWYVKRHAHYVEVKSDLRKQQREARIEALRTLPDYADIKERLEGYFENLDQIDDYYLLNLRPSKPVQEFLKERELDDASIRENLRWIGDKAILKMCEFRKEDERLQWLDQQMEKEMQAHLLWFVETVTKITGPITDAKGLHISGGELNGVVLGEKGAANVNTFSAGGWNIQRFHFRTRVDDVTKYIQPPSDKKLSLAEQIQSAAVRQKVAPGPESRKISPER